METSQRHRYRRFCLVSVGAAKSWPKRITKNKDISDILNHILVAFCKGYSKYLIFMWYINTDLYHDEHCHAFQFDYSGLTDSQKGYEGVWLIPANAEKPEDPRRARKADNKKPN